MLSPPSISPGARLRALYENGTALLPGAFNPISALVASAAGAQAVYLSGAGVTNANLGMPDIALATLTEFVAVASAVTAVCPAPVLADADTGFGETWNVFRTVVEMERAGLAGIHLEDQVMPKRCGHLDGKSLISTGDMVRKLSVAVNAKRDGTFVVVARTDARGVEGFDAAVARALAYVDAGCDAVFPEGLESLDEFKRFRDAVPGPLLANMTEFGKTPLIRHSQFESLGYQMVIFPMTAFRVMLQSLDETYRELLTAGTQQAILGKMKTRAELYELLNYQGYVDGDSTLDMAGKASEPSGSVG